MLVIFITLLSGEFAIDTIIIWTYHNLFLRLFHSEKKFQKSTVTRTYFCCHALLISHFYRMRCVNFTSKSQDNLSAIGVHLRPLQFKASLIWVALQMLCRLSPAQDSVAPSFVIKYKCNLKRTWFVTWIFLSHFLFSSFYCFIYQCWFVTSLFWTIQNKNIEGFVYVKYII